MYPLSIIVFFVYCWGIGLGLGRFVKESEDPLEKNLMRIGIGLGAILSLGLILNLLKIPLDWRIFLLLSIIPIVLTIFKVFKTNKNIFGNLKNFKINIYPLLMLILFFITLYMYVTGSFAYPYLEDDDPWSHAIGVKFVSIEKTIFEGTTESVHYVDPYPPLYDLILGVLHQTNDSVYWTLKFFNALFISLSIIFFYFFAKIFTNSSKKALFSTFALFALPSFLSHFIWAISLVVPLYFVSFYCIEKIKDDKKWWIIAAITIAATLTLTPSHSPYFGLLFSIYFVTKLIIEKRFLFYEFLSGFFGLAFSFIFWWLPMIIKHGAGGVVRGMGSITPANILSIGGTADRIYTLSDFIFAKKANLINNPIGIGIFLSLLTILTLVLLLYKHYDKLKKHLLLILLTFVIFNGIIIYFLSKTYIRQLFRTKAVLEDSGPIPFSVFFSEQSFLIFSLSFIIFVLVSMAIINYKNKNYKDNYLIITIAWLVFTFYAVNAGPYHYKLSPFRAWLVMAIPIALLSGEAISFIDNFIKALARNILGSKKILMTGASLFGIILMGYLIVNTSFIQKYTVNTATWGPGGFWVSGDEIGAYIWLRDNLEKNSKMFTFVNNAPVIGMDMYTCHWCTEVRDYQKNGFKETPKENYDWLKSKGYEYLIIDGQTIRKFGVNESNAKIKDLVELGLFNPIFQNQGAVILKI